MFGQAFQQSGFGRQRRAIVRGLALFGAAALLVTAPTPSASASNQPPNQPSPNPNPGGGAPPICKTGICVSDLKVTKKAFPTANNVGIYFEAHTNIPTYLEMQIALDDKTDAAGNLKNPITIGNYYNKPYQNHVISTLENPGKRYYWVLKFYVNGLTHFERGHVDAPVIVQGAGNNQIKP